MNDTTIARITDIFKQIKDGDHLESIEIVFEKINTFLSRNKKMVFLLARDYFVFLSQNDIIFFNYIVNIVLNGNYYYLAKSILISTIISFLSKRNNQLINLIFDLICCYKMDDYIHYKVDSSVFFVIAEEYRLVIDTELVNNPNKVLSLRMILDREYRRLFIDYLQESIDSLKSFQLIYSLIKRISDQPYSFLSAIPSLRVFTFKDIIFKPELPKLVFNMDLDVISYEDKVFDIYKIPLLPSFHNQMDIIFDEKKIVIRNSGSGYLPISNIRLMVDEKEIDVGDTTEIVQPQSVYEFFLSEIDVIKHFLNQHNLNKKSYLIIGFQKFSRYFDVIVPLQPVGKLLEKLPASLSMDVVTPQEINMSHLSDKEFERLCLWIVEDDGRFQDINWLNEDGGGERGRDIIATEKDTGRHFVFQCKRVEEFHPSNMISELNTFSKYIKDDPSIKPDVYILFISCSLTDKVHSKGKEIAKKMDFDIEFWYKGKIDKLVRQNPVIRDRFWKTVFWQSNNK